MQLLANKLFELARLIEATITGEQDATASNIVEDVFQRRQITSCRRRFQSRTKSRGAFQEQVYQPLCRRPISSQINQQIFQIAEVATLTITAALRHYRTPWLICIIRS
ncbi:MAG: hypothetical protein CVU33_03840 [Betaproteobacteria bacterium HGW-Betaproteobacteria-6]|nr:MAG: hypothetical protein CVU33_03840 [Betaproteobacteria bacterium HGW-Betaproteobacteria-6]